MAWENESKERRVRAVSFCVVLGDSLQIEVVPSLEASPGKVSPSSLPFFLHIWHVNVSKSPNSRKTAKFSSFGMTSSVFGLGININAL